MDLKPTFGIGDESSVLTVRHEFWPVDEINTTNAKFPCCLVWTPLPVVSWLAPFIGHVGICKEDGSIIDFSGSNLLNVDDFAYGAVARYIQLDREKVCFRDHSPVDFSMLLFCATPLSLSSLSYCMLLVRSIYCMCIISLDC